MIDQAVIIAAGKGSRLNGHTELPKPLVSVAGLGLLKRTILTATRAGISRFVVVVGHRADQIRAAISSDRQITAEIEWAYNPNWEAGNGLSVLAAKPYVGEAPFLLAMSDHLFDPQVAVTLRNASIGQGECALGVDHRVASVFDIDDATKVQVGSSGKVDEICKELTSYNAIDTGIFACTSALFDALETAIARGQDSLSGGIQQLAAEGRMRATDVGDLFWLDVDTPEALVHAERCLIKGLGKPSDGFVSRHFNRKVSTRISRVLVRTPVSPNQISLATMLLSFLASYLVADPSYLALALGGVLFQVASIVDGCDGEVAKLKFMGSRLGEWVDTFADNASYVVFFLGVAYGMYGVTGDPSLLMFAYFALASLIVALSLVFLYLRLSGSGSIVSFIQGFAIDVPAEQRGWFHRFCMRVKFAPRRDFFSALSCGLALVNARGAMYWIFVIGSILTAFSILVFVGHMMRSRRFWPSAGEAPAESDLASEKAD